MLFNSISFIIFLPIVFIAYWFICRNKLKFQNFVLLLGSYFFYGCWDYRFLLLLLFSTFLDYYSGIKMFESKIASTKKAWFLVSIFINLGFLGVFKYYNFFAESLATTLSEIGYHTDFLLINLILPVGISFYTFHGLSYVIDVYYDRIKPERNIVDYSLFVSFFPLLVAGPIERATHLLPQIKKNRQFDKILAIDGINQIIWGLLKKIVIADSCAVFASDIFDSYQSMNSLSLILGAIYFSFQIYGDFSGYSDIAIGTSKLFGIKLIRNFNFPYFSRDIAEFWRRWHISLSSWFRDYLYIPLGGSRGNIFLKIRNVMIIFLVSGFWHGANWTFIVWGAIHSLYFLPLLLTKSNRNNIVFEKLSFNLKSIKIFISVLFTFIKISFAWIFFRSKSVTDAFLYVQRMIFNADFKIQFLSMEKYSVELLLMILGFILIEWFIKNQEHPFSGKYSFLKVIGVILIIIIFGSFSEPSEFIYFQF